jgi:hypothetical protein
MSKGSVIYRLKDGRLPLSFGLPQNEIGIVKPEKVLNSLIIILVQIYL